MTLRTTFFEFGKKASADNEAEQIDQLLPKIQKRFASAESKIINVETIWPEYFLGFQTRKGGLRVWYRSKKEITEQDELLKDLLDQIEIDDVR